jgi:hypothetical protein
MLSLFVEIIVRYMLLLFVITASHTLLLVCSRTKEGIKGTLKCEPIEWIYR